MSIRAKIIKVLRWSKSHREDKEITALTFESDKPLTETIASAVGVTVKTLNQTDSKKGILTTNFEGINYRITIEKLERI